MSEPSSMTGFEVDLTNCDREPIHILGSVQPFGFLLAVNSDWVIVHASTSTLRYLGLAPADVLDKPLTQVMSGHAIHAIRGRLQVLRGADAVERMFGVPLTLVASTMCFGCSVRGPSPRCSVTVQRCVASS